MQDYPDKRFCVIGAGPSGLTVAKNFRQRNIPFDCFESQDDVGGNWFYGSPASSVYASTHLISSKRMTEYTDFPMPKGIAPYPSHVEVLSYLRSYADHFALREHITFGTVVRRVERAGSLWRVTTSPRNDPRAEVTRAYLGVVVANGHHWDPLLPELPGDFAGRVLHSHDYKTPNILADKRVLVVGAGNSGCDIAVESAQHAAATYLSMRRGYHFIPKFLLGRPTDRLADSLHRKHVPRWLQRWISTILVRIALGPPHRYGLPRPEHRLFETHPIINSQLLYYVGHGGIQPKPDIASAHGNTVRFRDGSEESIDTIIYATGFKVSFPFLDSRLILDDRNRPCLYLNVFHPEEENLFVAGLIQPNSGLWGLADYQAQLISAYIVARQQDSQRARWFRGLKAKPLDLGNGIRYVDSPRHVLEVEYYSYRRQLKKLLAEFGPSATLPYEAEHG